MVGLERVIPDYDSLIEHSASPIPALHDIAVPLISPVSEGPPDLIDGLMPRLGALVIAGETDIGKSTLALEMVSSLVTGIPLWGELKPTRQLKNVLYVLGEHHNETIQRLWQCTKLPMTEHVMLLGPEALSYDKWLVAGGRHNTIGIEKFKSWVKGMELVVFDPLSAFVVGADSENDNLVMRTVLEVMTMIAASADASCLILAHQGKPMRDKFGKEHARTSYAIRGASAIEDAATNIFYLNAARDEESGAAQRVADTGAKILELNRRKYKGVAPERFRLMKDPITLTSTLLGNRPYVEVLKIATQQKVSRLQTKRPDLKFSEAVQMVADVDGVDPKTIMRHLGLRD